MKQSAFVIAAVLLALVSATSTPARADYAVVQFEDGFCRIWWNSAGNPWGTGWTKLAIGLPSRDTAQVALDTAMAQGACR
jgi:hypothetical protein